MKNIITILIILTGALIMSACSSKTPNLTSPTPEYLNALNKATSAGVTLSPGSEEEKQALERIYKLFNEYTSEQLRVNIPETYAEDLFFRDGFKIKTDRSTLITYMAESTEPMRDCRFDFSPPAVHEGNYYLPWTMILEFKKDPEGEIQKVLGMSHLRFNEEGKIIFQQDYWDPSDIIYRRIPIMKWFVKKVRESV